MSIRWTDHGNAKRRIGRVLSLVILTLLSVWFALGTFAFAAELSEAELTRLRTQGAGLYENQDYAESIPCFEKCVELAPESATDRINLGLAYYRTREWQKAVEALETAKSLDSSYPNIAYALGLISKKNEAYETAVEQFEAVIAADPAAAAAYYNLGVVLEKLGRGDEAEKAFQAAVRHNPDNVSAHYYLYKYAKAAKRRDEAKREMKEFSRLQKSIPDKQRTEEAYEESPYLAPIIPPHQSFMPAASAHRDKIKFVDVTEERLGGISPFKADTTRTILYDPLMNPGQIRVSDVDGDNDLDLYLVRCSEAAEAKEFAANILYLNDGAGHFAETGAESNTNDDGCGYSVLMSDLDNNGTVDLLIVNLDDVVLLSNDGNGHFSDLSSKASFSGFGMVGDVEAADYDHDGDLDLVLGVFGSKPEGIDTDDYKVFINPANPIDPLRSKLIPLPNRIYRNNGDSTFSLIADSRWQGNDSAWTIDIEGGDFDGDEDTDILGYRNRNPAILWNVN